MENRERFHARLGWCTDEARERIDFAYDLSKEAHRVQRRDTGERYFEHPRGVAIILLDEAHVREPEIIVTALLHDTVEDSPLFGGEQLPREQLEAKARLRLTWIFGPRVADWVVRLSKPRPEGKTPKAKADAMAYYLRGIAEGAPEVILVKMADRLHNLRSLSRDRPEKIRKTVDETTTVYLPIFERLSHMRPREAGALLMEINAALDRLRA